MPMGYTPNREAAESNGGGKIPEGEYPFKVDEAEERQFRSGNMGCRLVLLVGAGNRDVKVFENLIYTDSSQWRLKQFFDCVGLDYMRPPETYELQNKVGRAKFKHNDKEYLEVDEFLPAPANNGPDIPMAGPGDFSEANPPPPSDDDVPF